MARKKSPEDPKPSGEAGRSPKGFASWTVTFTEPKAPGPVIDRDILPDDVTDIHEALRLSAENDESDKELKKDCNELNNSYLINVENNADEPAENAKNGLPKNGHFESTGTPGFSPCAKDVQRDILEKSGDGNQEVEAGKISGPGQGKMAAEEKKNSNEDPPGDDPDKTKSSQEEPPRKQTPGAENLIPLSQRSAEERQAICSMGGKARAEKLRKHATAKEAGEWVADLSPSMSKDTVQYFTSKGCEDPTYLDVIAYAMAQKAVRGDVDAAKFFLEIIEQDSRTKQHKDRMVLEREKMERERERYAQEHPRPDSEDVNAQILSIANLIANPVAERTLDALRAGGAVMQPALEEKSQDGGSA